MKDPTPAGKDLHGPCDHEWRWIHDWEGDPGVIGGTRSFSYRKCQKCDEQDFETPYDGSDDPERP